MTEQAAENSGNGKRKKAALAVFTVLTIIGLAATFAYVRYKDTHITTDDAFVEANIHVIAAKVPGTVAAVAVTDNQLVKKGDLLLEIDPKDYEVRTSEAAAAQAAERAKLGEVREGIAVVRKQAAELEAQLRTARANLAVQEANLRQADADLKRAERLLAKEAISRERFEKTKTGYDVSVAALQAARDQVSQAEAAIETNAAVLRRTESSAAAQTSQVNQRAAVLKAAELQQGYTRIYAPADGYVTKKSVQPGNQIQAGQPLMALVPLEEIWVVANYKETQLKKIRPGQSVDVYVDTFGKTYRGRVDSIMAGTGAVFSLFPPENATGNFVKVVQRVPVKIVFEKGQDTEHRLRVGMSVEPTVIVK
ncbi:MAG: HlyD family secretion protein [Thermodesulfovibrionales bacterium]